MRTWIATVAAYALALQVLLTGVAAGHFMAASDASASSPFVICHGNGSQDDQDLPGNEPLARSPCVLCTLAKVSCAILPTRHGIAVSEAMGISNAVARTDGPVLDDSVAKSSHSTFPRVQQCRHFKTCHVSPARFQSASGVHADRCWPASKDGL